MENRGSSKPTSEIAAAKLIKPASLRKLQPAHKSATSSDSCGPSDRSSKRQSIAESKSDAPSLYALFATKRLVSRFAEKMAAKRAEQAVGDDTLAQEPTYQLQPKIKLTCATLAGVVKEVADAQLHHLSSYSAKKCALVSKVLSEEIKDKVKSLGFERYKLVCLVTLGENKSQGVYVVSRCSWDANQDNYVTYNWKKENIFCTITVYGLYFE